MCFVIGTCFIGATLLGFYASSIFSEMKRDLGRPGVCWSTGGWIFLSIPDCLPGSCWTLLPQPFCWTADKCTLLPTMLMKLYVECGRRKVSAPLTLQWEVVHGLLNMVCSPYLDRSSALSIARSSLFLPMSPSLTPLTPELRSYVPGGSKQLLCFLFASCTVCNSSHHGL